MSSLRPVSFPLSPIASPPEEPDFFISGLETKIWSPKNSQLVSDTEENMDSGQQLAKRNVQVLDPAELPSTPIKRYKKTTEIVGEGGNGLVTKATDIFTESPVAVKTHEPVKGAYTTAIEESDILYYHETIGTPHSLPFRASFDSTPKKGKNGTLCPMHTIVTNLVPAKDLFLTYLIEKAPRPPLGSSDIKTIFHELLEFIDASQANQMAHLDLKPSNIIYNESTRQITVVDFGLSEIQGVTPPHWLCQTTPYRCPEEMFGFEDQAAPPRSSSWDVWSVGCIIYELFTGKELFPTSDDYDNIRSTFKLHLQMIARSIGMPKPKYLKTWEKASFFYAISSLPPHQVRIKKPKKLEKITDWKAAITDAVKKRGMSADECSLLIDILKKMISYGDERASAAELLKHPYLADDVSFHLQGNFFKQDTISISRECDTAPSIVINRSSRICDDCLHISQDPNKRYLITVERDSKTVFSEYFSFEDKGEAVLKLPEEDHRSDFYVRNAQLKKVLFPETIAAFPPPLSPSLFEN